MEKYSERLRVVFLVALSVLLSSTTVILGAAPLRVLRFTLGYKNFGVLVGIVVVSMAVIGLWPLATTFFVLASLSAIFYQMEQRGQSFFISGLASVIGAILLGTLLQLGLNNFEFQAVLAGIEQQVGQFVLQVKQINPKIKIESKVIMEQLPSVFVVVLILALGMSFVLERRLLRWLGKTEGVSRISLLKFKMPDWAVWFLMFAFLFSFKNFGVKGLEIVSVNTLNVLSVLFFWQGMAIVATFFAVKRVNSIWQYLAYFFLVTQLFAGVALVGIIDFWLDFRRKLAEPKGL